MRVGILLGNQSLDVGGGYTFEAEVFQSLVKVGAGSHHTFILCSKQKEPPPELSSIRHIEFISVNRSFEEQLQSKLSRIAEAIIHKLQHPRSQFKVQSVNEKFIMELIENKNIEAIWSLGPYNLTMEVPYITTVWDLQHRLQPYFPEVSSKGEWNSRETSYSTMLQRSAFILVGTYAGRAEVERFYQIPPERIKVIPFPTPQFTLNASDCFERVIFEKYNIPDKYLFYPAQFWAHKNHANLLLAVKCLRDKYSLTFPVVFSGSNKGTQQYIRQLAAKLQLSEQVYFLGFVPQEDLISLYRHAFALTFVTFFGPDNLPPLEAFALGCPVVASKVTGAEEQLGDAALLVDPKDPEHIASAIKLLWDDISVRQQLIERGFERAMKWNGQDYVKEVFSILDELESIRRCWSCSLPDMNLECK
ncbi:group 1 glycosyl transferase [Nostocales cyanobacterium HT-58-2]|nr:group 1 glycosyl transferase [Nostocales cyanobacterium HT-58-2]